MWLGADDLVSEGNWVYTENGKTFSTSNFDWYPGRFTCIIYSVVWVQKLDFQSCDREQLEMSHRSLPLINSFNKIEAANIPIQAMFL